MNATLRAHLARMYDVQRANPFCGVARDVRKMLTRAQAPQGYQQRIKRLVQSQAWAANQVLTVPLPRNYDLESVYITITGTENYPAALVAACVRSDAPYGLIQRVEVIAEGRQTLISVPGYMLGMMNIRRHNRPTYLERAESWNNHQNPPLVYTSPTSSMPVSTSVPFAGTFIIDFQNIMGFRPKDTNFRTGGLQTLDLKLTFADQPSMFYGAASSVTPFAAPALNSSTPTLTGYTMTPGTVYVDLSEIQELADPKTGQISSPTSTQRWSNQQINLPAVQNNLQTLLPTDNFVGMVLLNTKIGTESVNGMLSGFRLQRGIDVRYNLDEPVVRALMQRDYDYVLQKGLYAMDLMMSGNQFGKMSETWNLQGGADTRIGVDVIAAGAGTTSTADITTCEYIPLRAG
jgi:hypothetical protein